MTERPDDTDKFLALARWRSRRGMLELDFFLVGFAEERLPQLGPAEQDAYFALLACEDIDIHAWLTGRGAPAESRLRAIVASIRDHAAVRRT